MWIILLNILLCLCTKFRWLIWVFWLWTGHPSRDRGRYPHRPAWCWLWPCRWDYASQHLWSQSSNWSVGLYQQPYNRSDCFQEKEKEADDCRKGQSSHDHIRNTKLCVLQHRCGVANVLPEDSSVWIKCLPAGSGWYQHDQCGNEPTHGWWTAMAMGKEGIR